MSNNRFMNIKNYLKRAAHFLLFGIPEIHTTAHIVSLAPNELLQERMALITGGTSGIGYSIAKAFLYSGAIVCITSRNEERLKAACMQLKAIQPFFEDRVYGIVMDNKRIADFPKKIDDILLMSGRKSIDILVNNAGVLGGDISTTTEDIYDEILDTNLKGVFFLSQTMGRYMRDNHIKGNILNIASSSSLRPATSAYTLTKWGTRGLTLGLAKVLAPYGITVNGIAPGPTATPMLGKDEEGDIAFLTNPLGRYVLPEEIANMAVFLVSDMGRSIVGDIVYMTGGSGVVTFDDVAYRF